MPDAGDALRDNIRRLSELETEIGELSKMERVFEKIGDLEVGLQRLADRVQRSVSEAEMRDVKKELKSLAELKPLLEKRVEGAEAAAREQAARLTQVDTEVIRDIERLSKIFDKVGDLSGQVERLAHSGFVNEKRLEEHAAALEEKIDEAKRRVDPRIVAQELALRKLADRADSLVTREELAELRGDIKEIRASVEVLDHRLAALGGALRESVARLSEVDGKMIDDLGGIQKVLERVSDVERAARRLSEASAGFVTQKELADSAAGVLERVDVLGKQLERATAIEGALKTLRELAEGAARRGELERLRDELKTLGVGELRNALAKQTAEMEATKVDIERLSKVDAEVIKELAKLSRIYVKINDHEVALRKLADSLDTLARRRGAPEEVAKPPEWTERREKIGVGGADASTPIGVGGADAHTVKPPVPDRAALERERRELLEMAEALRGDRSRGLISAESYGETVRGVLRRLAEIEAELGEGKSPERAALETELK